MPLDRTAASVERYQTEDLAGDSAARGTRRAQASPYKAGRCVNARCGMAGRAWVDATPVREHVRRLLAAGLTKPQIARRCGLATNTITALVEGVQGRGPSLRVQRTTAAQLFAVEPDRVGPEDGGWVDPIGTTRRLRSLSRWAGR